MQHRRMSVGSISRPVGLFVFVVVLVFGVLLLGTVGQIGQAHASGPEPPLLPNLVADPPDNISLETSQHEGGLSEKKVTPELLLRFNGYIHNDGSGPLDFRGEREAPKVSRETEKEVEGLSESEPELSPQAEAELAKPPMKVFQRVFTTNARGSSESNIEYLNRPHKDESSNAEMFYVNADGHHHWHLQHVAKYSLWNFEKTVEVAPAEKVGFCLEDSEHVEPSVGPSTAVYADDVPPGRDFCQQFHPNATSVYEGISPGWRDAYTSNLGFQWVDASNVSPGEYWLREEVNPEKTIKEEGVGSKVAYAEEPTTIPGFDAQAQTTGTSAGQAATITLSSQAFEDSASPTYTIVSQPQHGTLGAVHGDRVLYTPNPGYAGPDSFSFAAADPNSEFPRSPAVATVSIEVGPAQSANVASAILPAAPAIAPVTPPVAMAPAPGVPVTGVSRPRVTLIGHTLIMTTRTSEAGRVRLSAYLGERRLGTCVTETPANRTFTCRLTLGGRVPLDARISVWASLRVGRLILRQLRPAARVQEMKMRSGNGLVPGLVLAGGREPPLQLLCGPELATPPRLPA
jgi:hypothetical protein